jgi:hypothetical protein
MISQRCKSGRRDKTEERITQKERGKTRETKKTMLKSPQSYQHRIHAVVCFLSPVLQAHCALSR